MAPVIRSLTKSVDIKICVTAQHREMLDQVLDLFEIKPDIDLNIMKSGQDLNDITSEVLRKLKKILKQEKPDLVLVHGDTSTSMAAAMASFYLKIPVGHVEAGLRTHNINSPFPEEFNRQITSKIAAIHFAPTKIARNNLLRENIDDHKIYVTGNTVIDALISVSKKAKYIKFPKEILFKLPFLDHEKEKIPRIILVTGHRRENFGKGFEEICSALFEIAESNPTTQIVYPVHLNPNVRIPVEKIISNVSNINLIEPLDYLFFVKLMHLSYLILTDSGGIQEEAPSLGKPVLLMRDSTERPEAIDAGTVELVGSDRKKIVKTVSNLLNNKDKYKKMSKAHNPYGDGYSSERISEIIKRIIL